MASKISTVKIALAGTGTVDLAAAAAGSIVRLLAFMLTSVGDATHSFNSRTAGGANTSLTGDLQSIKGVPLRDEAPVRPTQRLALVESAAGCGMQYVGTSATAIAGYAIIETQTIGGG